MSQWREIDSLRGNLFPSTKRPPGGITQAEYAKRYGVTLQAARWQLKRLEEMGKVKRELVSISGKATNVYIPVRRLPCRNSGGTRKSTQ